MTEPETAEELVAEEQIDRSLNLILEPDAVVELRILGAGRRGVTLAGYFEPDYRRRLIDAALEHNGSAHGIFITLNPLHDGVIARQRPNALAEFYGNTSNGGLTKDIDILRRLWLPVDFDPVRPSGISSTDAEKALALIQMKRCYKHFEKEGWPLPAAGDSGNGYHLLWRIELDNSAETKQQVKSLLEDIKDKFETPQVKVDAEVFNAARIWKLYGSTAAKGDNYICESNPAKSRPHRVSSLLHVPEDIKKCPM